MLPDAPPAQIGPPAALRKEQFAVPGLVVSVPFAPVILISIAPPVNVCTPFTPPLKNGTSPIRRLVFATGASMKMPAESS